MNTQMDRPRGYGDTHDLTSTGFQHSGMEDERHDETEHHGEKKSVLKKVKEKAKKIKETIKCGVGHGHDHDKEDDDNEMVTDRNVHSAPRAAHGITTGKTDTTRLHGPNIVETTTIKGQVPVRNPQVVDTKTTHRVTGQEETLGGSRVDTLGHDNQVHGLRHPHVLDSHSVRTHGPKHEGILEKDPHALKHVGDVNPASHQTDLTDPSRGNLAARHGITSSTEDKARQLGTNIAERTQIEGRVPVSNPGPYQVSDTTTTHSVTGEQKIMGWSKTDKQMPLGSDNQAQGLRHKPAFESHAGGTDRPKVGGILEKDARAPKNIGEDIHHANRQSDLTYPASGGLHGITTSKEDIARQHGTNVGERTAIGNQVPVTSPSAHQVFDTTTTHYVPGQEETLGWSRTDKRTPLGSESQPHGLRHTPVLAGHHSGGTHSTGDLGVGHKPKLGGILERDTHALKDVGQDVRSANYQPNVTNLRGEANVPAPSQDIGLGLGQGGTTARRHEGYLEERGTTKGASNIPGIKPIEQRTFDKGTAGYVPEHRETLGLARTEERPYMTKNSPHTASLGGHFGTQVTSSGQKGDYGRLGEVLEKSTGLEKDPHAPRDIGEMGRAEYHQAKVTDPLGRGSEEIGVTPILHQLGKMNVHGDTAQNPDSYMNPIISTGSHDQFSPEPITPETSTFLQPHYKPQSHTTLSSSHQGFQDESNREPGSNYTNMISSAASELAHKAKVVTNSVTSKLGYSGNSETSRNTSTVSSEHQPAQGPLDSEPVPGGYGEKLSTVSVAVADTVSKAKDAVASKLGYGSEAYEAQSDEPYVGSVGDYAMNDEAQEAGESNAGSIGDYGKKVVSTVQEKIAPVYEKVAGLGSTVASKVRGSGTEGEMESTLEPDNGVSVKEGKMESIESDKGVSVKEYLAEKLMPGEEDQALSKVITEAIPLHKQEEDENEIGLGQGDEMLNVDEPVLGRGHEAINVDDIGFGQGDEVMRVEIEERAIESGRETSKTKVVITGQMTESEEVPHYLGRAEETSYDDDSSGVVNPGKSVMDRIKDAAGSLFSKSSEAGEQSTEGNERSQSSKIRELQHEQNLNAREARLQ